MTGSLGRFRWYYHRLRAMRPAEVALRLGRNLRNLRDRLGVVPDEKGLLGSPPDAETFFAGHRFLFSPEERSAHRERYQRHLPDELADIRRRSSEIQAGRFRLYGGEPVDVPQPIDWHRDPETGESWPLAFWTQLHPNFTGGGEARTIWELGRQGALYDLGKAFWLDGDEAAAETARDLIESWIDQNPPLHGIHWFSPLEASIRIVAWTFTLHWLQAATVLDEAFLRKCLGSIARQARFIEGNVSRFSSTNNHTVGEAVGLLTAGVILPTSPCAEQWRRTGQELLERVFPQQIHSDGTPIEQAFHYGAFLLDWVAFGWQIGERNGVRWSPKLREAILALGRFFQEVVPEGGALPAVGDSDDGFALGWLGGNDRPGPAALNFCAAFARRSDWVRPHEPVDEKTLWLLGSEAVQWLRDSEPQRPRPGLVTLREGGYSIHRGRVGPSEEYLLFDHGPLGMPPLRGHGHADALQICLSLAGEPLLIDPGTYRYHRGGAWREYFKSLRAHNTASLELLDPIPSHGPFHWGQPLDGRLELAWHQGELVRLKASHEAWRLSGEAGAHVRWVQRLDAGLWLVIDRIPGSTRAIVQHFHLGRGQCELAGAGWLLRGRRGGLLRLTPHAGAIAHLLEGDADARGGWHSPRFDVLEEGRTVQVWGQPGQDMIATLLQVGPKVTAAPDVELDLLWEADQRSARVRLGESVWHANLV
ncbi:MAG: alginate lyase family protein [Planctomycetota bacterium]